MTVHNLAWVIMLVWFAFDHFGASRSGGDVAYWSHAGGFVSGVSLALLMLKLNWVTLTEWDNPTLLDLIRGQRVRR